MPICENLSCIPNIRTNRGIGSYEGGEIVTARFKDWFKKKFQRSKRLKGEPNATAATKNFDTGTKTTFSDDTKIYRVKVGSPRDNEPGKDVKNGMASVPGLVIVPSHAEGVIRPLPPGTRLKSSSHLPSTPSSVVLGV